MQNATWLQSSADCETAMRTIHLIADALEEAVDDRSVVTVEDAFNRILSKLDLFAVHVHAVEQQLKERVH